MSIRAQLDATLKEAMKARDQVKVDTIRGIKSAVKYKEVEGGEARVLPDDEIIKVVTTLVKQRKEAAEQFKAGNRPDLAEKEERELAILQTFLPAQLTAEELAALVTATVAETGAKTPKEMGLVMKALQPKIAGRADGKLASELVKKALAGG